MGQPKRRNVLKSVWDYVTGEISGTNRNKELHDNSLAIYYQQQKEYEDKLKSLRVRPNDSPTRYSSERLEQDRYLAMQKENMGFPTIPYIEEQEITIPGIGRTTRNTLDSAAKYAIQAHVKPSEFISVLGKESKLGAMPGIEVPSQKQYEANKEYWDELAGVTNYKDLTRAAYNMNVHRAYGEITPNWLANAVDTFNKGYANSKYKNEFDYSKNPLYNAAVLYRLGLYNPGEPGYNKDVQARATELRKTKAYQDWARNSQFSLQGDY